MENLAVSHESIGRRREWWWPIVRFALHEIVGCTLFVVVYLPALGLHELVYWLQSLELGSLFIITVEVAEYILLLCDTFLFVVFNLAETVKASRELWKVE